ncbi:MAG: hypothetical protein U0Z44_14685 [Kouleothrix sp.]
MFVQRGQFNAAIADYDALIEQALADPALYIERARVFARRGERDRQRQRRLRARHADR